MPRFVIRPPVLDAFTFQLGGEECVKVYWFGAAGRTSAVFDSCPVRGLTAEESADEWCRRVLGVGILDRDNV